MLSVDNLFLSVQSRVEVVGCRKFSVQRAVSGEHQRAVYNEQ